MTGITTHVLDTSGGHPAAGVHVLLEALSGGGWQSVAQGTTDSDGRLRSLLNEAPHPGAYRLVFDTRASCREFLIDAPKNRLTLSDARLLPQVEGAKH